MTTSENTTSTFSIHSDPWGGGIVSDLMRHVRFTPLDSDAINNIPIILEQYKKSLSAWELIKLLLTK